jgi:hypothetical protein
MAYRSYEDHIADILVTKGFRRFVGNAAQDWDITVGKMLDAPNRQITIYRTGGLAKNPRWLLDYPSIQVKVRGGPNDYLLSQQKAVLANEALLGIESFTASNGDRIVHINAIGDVASTGWDDEKRPEWTFNLRLITEPAAGNLPGTNREAL